LQPLAHQPTTHFKRQDSERYGQRSVFQATLSAISSSFHIITVQACNKYEHAQEQAMCNNNLFYLWSKLTKPSLPLRTKSLPSVTRI